MKIHNILFLIYILFILSIYISTSFDLIAPEYIYLSIVLAIIPIALEAARQLWAKKIGTEIFLVIATVIALIGKQEHAIAVILLIMLIAEYLEGLIEGRTEHELKSLISLIPQTVIIKTPDGEKIASIETVLPGMLIVVATGRRIPVDGIIQRGSAAINESALTGESKIHTKAVGDNVWAGTFIESGSIVVKVERVGTETFFGKIKILVEQAEEAKAKISTYADRIALFLVPSILLFIALVWFFTHDFRLIVTLLVFGSPLELTLITPLAILSGVTAAFGHGILVKGGLALERFSQVDTIIFDKTGTLTMGEPQVIKIQAINPDITEQELLKIAAIAEKHSDHVFARAVLNKAHELGIIVPDPDTYMSLAGHGIEIMYKQKKYFIGNRHFIQASEHANVPIDSTKDVQLFAQEDKRYTSFYIASSEKLYGKIYVADQLRPEAKDIISSLKESGIAHIMLLSGDRQDVTSAVADQLGIKEAHGDMFPDQKIEFVRSLQLNGRKVAMVGDGINDAPALKQAFVGIALGAMGMEPAIEAADIVLMTNDLEKIVFVYQLSKKTMRVIKENLIIGFGVIHTIGLILAFLRLISPIQAALFHAIPDLSILFNSIRLIRFGQK